MSLEIVEDPTTQCIDDRYESRHFANSIPGADMGLVMALKEYFDKFDKGKDFKYVVEIVADFKNNVENQDFCYHTHKKDSENLRKCGHIDKTIEDNDDIHAMKESIEELKDRYNFSLTELTGGHEEKYHLFNFDEDFEARKKLYVKNGGKGESHFAFDIIYAKNLFKRLVDYLNENAELNIEEDELWDIFAKQSINTLVKLAPKLSVTTLYEGGFKNHGSVGRAEEAGDFFAGIIDKYMQKALKVVD